MSPNSEVLNTPIAEDKPLLVHVEQPSTAAMLRSANVKMEIVSDFAVTTVEEAELAGEELRSIKAMIKSLDDKRKAITRPLDAAKTATMDLFREPLAVLERAQEVIRTAIGKFQAEQARLAREAQIRADAEAAEARKKIEEEAKAAAEAGQPELAATLTDAASLMIGPVGAVVQTKVKGLGSRSTWKSRVTNVVAFIEYAIKSERADLLAMVSIDQSALNKYAVATKGAMKIPGVEFYEDSTVVSRAA